MRKETSLLKAFFFGVLGSTVGLLAMQLYWNWIAPQLRGAAPEELDRVPEGEAAERLKEVALFGRKYRDDESAAAALGRMAYTQITGQEPPDQETRTWLSYLVHWSYGALQGGLYGVLRRNAAWPDLFGGLAFSTGLWLFGDEIAVPMLGLQEGPAAVEPITHLNRLGGHWSYGLGTALAAQTLRRLLS